MRSFGILVIAYLSFIGPSRAEIVLQRFGGTAGTDITLGSTIFSVSFTPTTLSRLNSISLAVDNTFATDQSLQLRFSFNSNLSSPFQDSSQTIVSAGGPSAYTFSLGGNDGPDVDTTARTLYFGFLSATGGATSSNFALGTNNAALTQAWSSGASTSNNFTFVLNATAVPEPSTLILSAGALAFGFGARFIRRKRAKGSSLPT